MAVSGVSVKVEVDLRPAIDALRRLAAADRTAIPAAHADFGEHLVNSHQERFAREQAPDGSPWAPLSPAYAKRKASGRGNRKILQRSGLLFGSLHYQVEGEVLRFGVNRIYAAAHQFGRPEINLPARPFIGLSVEDLDEAAAVYLDHLEAVFRGGGPR